MTYNLGQAGEILEIHTLTGKAYLLGAHEGFVAVDALTPWQRRTVFRVINNAVSASQPLRLILITHGHIDHYSGALDLQRATGAPIAIHELDAEWFRRGVNSPLHPRNFPETAMKFFFSRMKTATGEPDVILRGEEGDLTEFGLNARWLHTPGHSDGSLSIVFPGEVAIVGDLVIGRFGFTKKPAYPLWVKDVRQLKRSIARVLDLSPRFLLSGHGGPFPADEVRRVFLE